MKGEGNGSLGWKIKGKASYDSKFDTSLQIKEEILEEDVKRGGQKR
jgi:hypothetical protein